jgi:cytochrome c oxidase subunit 1
MPPSPATLSRYSRIAFPRRESSIATVRATAPGSFTAARAWFLLAIGSLVLAGLLSLMLVVGRLPFLGWLFTDPLFFKRALVVHVNLAMVIWFQAGTAAFLGLALGKRISRGRTALSLALGVTGVLGLLAGAVMPGAQPILANYVPVIDHPVFLAGLVCWFAGAGLFFATALATSADPDNALPEDTLIALRASAAANLIAIATLAVAWRTTLSGLPTIGYYELVAWGGGHVLQVANVAAMLGLWLMLLHRWSGQAVLSPPASRWLLTALVLPCVSVPLLALGGTSSTGYTQGSTELMRWTIFPVGLIVLGLSLRHVVRHQVAGARLAHDWRIVGFAGSAALTVLGFILGALIRSSTTLVPGHYHCAIGAVTIALMTAAYEFCGIVSPVAAIAPALRRARLQLLLFGGGQAVFGLGFALAGAYGLGRKQYGAEQHVRSLGEYLGLGVMGAGGLVAVAGGLLFLAVMLRCIGTWRHRSTQPA